VRLTQLRHFPAQAADLFVLAHQLTVSGKHNRERPARARFRLAPLLPEHARADA
jgi:hypothetical protein